MVWSKINAMIFIAIIALVGAGVARTAYFDNKTDALQALDDPVALTGGDCKVLTVEEKIESGQAEGDIVVTYEVQFYKPNYDRRIGTTVVSSTNQATIENEIKDDCDAKWASIKNEPQFQTVDTVVVEWHKGTAAGILERLYSVIDKKWRNASAAQAEP